MSKARTPQNWTRPSTHVIMLFWCLVLTLVIAPVQAQDSSQECRAILAEAVEATLIGSADRVASQIVNLPSGTPVEFIGRSANGDQWLIRYADGVVFHPTSGMQIPDGCIVRRLGSPSPNYLPLHQIMTEIGVDDWHEEGYFGQGVRVGVLDSRFDGLESFLAASLSLADRIELLQPLADMVAVAPEAEGTDPYHGTNMLEILTAIAPEANYVIAKAVDATTFGQAVDALIDAQVQIIVHAGNVITADPTPYHEAVTRATNEGILWVNSAGNIGAGYYPGRFSGSREWLPLHQFDDPNRAGVQQALMVPVDRDRNAQVTLVWDPATNITGQNVNDLDLVVSGNCKPAEHGFGELISGVTQVLTQTETIEAIRITSGDLRLIGDYLAIPVQGQLQTCPPEASSDGIPDNEIYISILDPEQTTVTDTRFDLYIEGALPAELDPDMQQSLDPVVLVPGDLPEVLTVGAFDPATNQMAWYSGRSNSLQYYELNNYEVDYSDDERVKPEIVTYGDVLLSDVRQFSGTSAATSIVTGSLALIASQMEEFDRRTLREMLLETHVACLDDGAIGHGIARLQTRLSSSNQILVEHTSQPCGKYAWQSDLSSTYTHNFHTPELAELNASIQSLTNEALGNELAQISTAVWQGDSSQIDLALLLAVEANHLARTEQTRAALMQSLQFSPHLFGILRYETSTSCLQSLAFSGDNRFVAVSHGQNLDLWDLQNMAIERTSVLQSPPNDRLDYIEFVGNEALLSQHNQYIGLWNLRTGHQINSLEFDSTVTDITLSPNQQLFSVSTPTKVFVVDVSQWEVVDTIELSTDEYVDSTAFSANSNELAIATHESVYIRNLSEKATTLVYTEEDSDAYWISHIEYRDDGPYLVWLYGSGQVAVKNMGRLSYMPPVFLPAPTLNPAERGATIYQHFGTGISPNGEFALMEVRDELSSEGNYILQDVRTGGRVGFLHGQDEPMRWELGFAFSNDSKLMATGDCRGRIFLWTVAPLAHHVTVSEQQLSVDLIEEVHLTGDVAITSNGRRFTSSGNAEEFYEWSESGDIAGQFGTYIPSGGWLQEPTTGQRIRSSADGTVVATVGQEQGILWDTASGHQLMVVDGVLRDLTVSNDGQLVAVLGRNGSVSINETVTHKILAIIDAESAVNCLGLSPNNDFLFTGGRRALLWDVLSNTLVYDFRSDSNWIYCQVAFSVDGGLVAYSEGSPQVIHVWSFPDRREVHRLLSGHTSQIIQLVFSPDQRYLAALDHSQNITLWDMTSGIQLVHYNISETLGRVLFGNESAIHFSSNGEELLATANDGTLVRWNLSLSSLIDAACKMANRNLTQEEWDAFVRFGAYTPSCRANW